MQLKLGGNAKEALEQLDEETMQKTLRPEAKLA